MQASLNHYEAGPPAEGERLSFYEYDRDSELPAGQADRVRELTLMPE